MTQTFTPSGEFQPFTVPSSTTKLNVICVASKGCNWSANGANGGKVECILPVTPGSTLYFVVGNIPSDPAVATYNASDIRTDNTGILDSASLSSRLLVAGGGGSSCNNVNIAPGAGGGLNGGDSSNSSSTKGGQGGTQNGGGSYGGTFGLGGNPQHPESGGAAGGAGWYGGGGAGSHFSISGGGGSSYTDASCYRVKHTQGANNGQGYITITYVMESTASDYDFYKDTAEYKIVKKTENGVDTYSALKSWEKGQYYGS